MRIRVLLATGQVEQDGGRVGGALAVYDAALRVAIDERRSSLAATARVSVALAASLLGDLERAAAAAAEALAESRRSGSPRKQLAALLNLLDVRVERGELGEALALLEDASHLSGGLDPATAPVLAIQRGALLAELGRAAEARQALAGVARESRGRPAAAASFRLGVLEAEHGGEAERWLGEAVARAGTEGDVLVQALALAALSRWASRARDLARGERLLRSVPEAALESRTVAREAALAEGVLRLGSGDLAAALAALSRSAEIASGQGARLRAAECLGELVRARTAAGQGEGALDAAGEARGLLEAVAAELPSAAERDRFLARPLWCRLLDHR